MSWPVSTRHALYLWHRVLEWLALAVVVLLASKWLALTTVLGVVALSVVLAHSGRIFLARQGARSARRVQWLQRLPDGRWLLVFDDGHVVTGTIRTVWSSPYWIALRWQALDDGPSRLIGFWRWSLSPCRWHSLRVWVAWELCQTTARPKESVM